MTVTLESGGSRAPGAYILTAEDGRDLFVQSDWDFPALASALGWAPCHNGTDGTVDCRECGKTAGEMIAEAREWLDDHDEEEFEDPGYFSGE